MAAGVRHCDAITDGGEPCRAAPLRDAPYCFWHSPDHQQEAQEARRLGGVRRRREGTIAGVYEVEGVQTPRQIQRIVEIAILDTLELPNSVARNRTLGALVQTAQRVIEANELEARLAALEARHAAG